MASKVVRDNEDAPEGDGEMFSGNGRKELLVFLSLLVASAAVAAPTVGDHRRDAVTRTVSVSSDAPAIGTYEINQIGERANFHLASAAAEFLKPPTDTIPQMQAKSLPAVPGALFLGLTGFLCVSLVKDRRVWLTALTGLLWAGQTGIGAIPQLALRLSHANHSNKRSSTEIAYCITGFQPVMPRPGWPWYCEGTDFIGLLRHLAGIPAIANSVQRRACTLHTKHYTNAVKHLDDKVTQFAIIKLLPEVILPTNCLVFTAEQAVPFSPAFIFSCLARGPPERA